MKDGLFTDPNSKWPYAPLMFGNQTAIEVQVPVSLNGGPALYFPLGLTWGDLIDANARWLKASDDRSARAPCLKIVRPPSTGLGGGNNGEYRFHSLPGKSLRQIEVAPGDAIFYRGR
jgi:hypothetical protein